MFACAYGAAFGAIQQMPRIVPGLPEVRDAGAAATAADRGGVQSYQEVGGLVGRFALAFLALRIVSRRRLLRVFQIPGLVIVPLVFFYAANTSLDPRAGGASSWRASSPSRSSASGGTTCRASTRPTCAAPARASPPTSAAACSARASRFVTTQLVNVMPGSTPPMRLAYASAAVALFVYAMGLACSALLPEPKGEGLPE